MISVEKNRLRWTSPAAVMIRSETLCSAAAGALRCRKMHSTMMTEESTMIPKSTAPEDSRLAERPREVEEGEGEHQRQGDVDRHDERRPQVVEEHEQDRGPRAPSRRRGSRGPFRSCGG